MVADQGPGLIENLDTAASALESLATAIAIVVGAIWAYFKFIKDRVYRPRLDISIEPRVFIIENRENLLCHLVVKNIGTSKVALVQEGTCLILTRGDSGGEPYRMPTWAESSVYEVFPDHDWIESGETIHHDLSVALPPQRRDVLMLKLRLICKQRRGNIETTSRAILPPGIPSKEVREDANLSET